MLLQAPPEPLRAREVRIDAATTPTRLTLRVMAGAPRFTVPAAVLSVTHQIGEALVPVLVGVTIERAVSTGDGGQLLLWLAVLAADVLMLSFSWRFGSRLAELGMLTVQHALRERVVGHLLRRAPRAGRPSEQPGVAVSIGTSDVNRLSEAVEIAVYPLGQLAAVLFGGAVLLSVAWPLGVAVLVGVPVLLWVTERAGRTLRDRSGVEQEAAATAAGRAADLLAGYRVVRGIGAEDEAARRYRRASRAALHDTLRARRAEGTFGGTMSAVTGLYLTAIAVWAGLLAAHGAIGLGAFVAVVGLTQFLIDPLASLALSTGSWWASATASASRVLDLLRDSERASAARESEGARRSLDASVDTAADPGVSRLLSALSDVPPGALVVAEVGGPAAEAVLARLPERHPDALHVPHGAHLFSGSVHENIALGGAADGARIAAAAEWAACDDVEAALPRGFDSPVGEGGSALSGGQRQRVALARALARDADLLVLHEPTTAVDAVTEALIASRLRRARAGRRTIVVSRSPAFVAVADRVVREGDA